MQHIIKPVNVMAVVVEVDRCLKAKANEMNLNQAEVMIGLQELVGRVIVDMSANRIGVDELVGHAKVHLDNTVRIGMQAKGRTALAS